MRDILAALLRSRGYTHDDETDPRDMYWYGDHLGVRPMLVCVSHEMNRDAAARGEKAVGWDTYDVSVAAAAYEPQRATEQQQ